MPLGHYILFDKFQVQAEQIKPIYRLIILCFFSQKISTKIFYFYFYFNLMFISQVYDKDFQFQKITSQNLQQDFNQQQKKISLNNCFMQEGNSWQRPKRRQRQSDQRQKSRPNKKVKTQQLIKIQEPQNTEPKIDKEQQAYLLSDNNASQSQEQNSNRVKNQYILSYETLRKKKNQKKQGQKLTKKILNKIKFYFPFEKLNDPQKKFIFNMFKSLNKGQNYMVESSTGTGKTLSLLCGSLAWAQYAHKMHKKYSNIPNKTQVLKIQKQILKIQQLKNIKIFYTSRAHSQLSQIQKQLFKIPYRPSMVIYGSRQKLCINGIIQWLNGKSNSQNKPQQWYKKCNIAVGCKKFHTLEPKNYQKQLKGTKQTVLTLVQSMLSSSESSFNQQFKQMQNVAYKYLGYDTSSNLDSYIPIKNKYTSQHKKLKLQDEGEQNNNNNNENRQQQNDDGWKQIEQRFKKQRYDIYCTNKIIQRCSGTVTQNKDLLKMWGSLLNLQSKCNHYHKKQLGQEIKFFQHIDRQPLNNESLKKQALNFTPTVCPFVLSKRVGGMGQLYLMPYTYLLNEKLFPYMSNLINNSIILFDQGHNVESSACDGYSASLTQDDITYAIQNIKEGGYDKTTDKYAKKQQKDRDVQQIQMALMLEDQLQKQLEAELNVKFEYKDSFRERLGEKIFAQLKKEFGDFSNTQLQLRLKKWLVKILELVKLSFKRYYAQPRTKVSDDYVDAYKTRTQIGQNWQSHSYKHTSVRPEILHFIKTILFTFDNQNRPDFQYSWDQDQESNHLNIIRMIYKKIDQMVNLKYSKDLFNFKLQNLKYFFKKTVEVLYIQKYQKQYYLNSVQEVRKQKDKKDNQYKGQLQIRCLTAQFAFKNIQACHPRSVIVTSGTLEPLDQLKGQLGIKFGKTIKAGSVIQSENIRVQKIGIDVNGNQIQIDSKFFYDKVANKYRNDNMERLFRLLIKIIPNIPNGVLVVCSSFSTLNTLKNFLTFRKNLNLYEEVKKLKDYVEFQTKKVKVQNLMKDYSYHAQNSPKGALLFCVCRAKFTEGIDFKDNLCRGVIFLGIPHLPPDSAQVKQKQKYLRDVRGDRNYQDWRYIEAAKAINQSLGRVVRDANDYGSIILIDQRYHNDSNDARAGVVRNNISDWIKQRQQQVKTTKELDQMCKDFKKFYSEREAQFKSRYKPSSQSEANSQQNLNIPKRNFKDQVKYEDTGYLSSRYHNKIQDDQKMIQQNQYKRLIKKSIQQSINIDPQRKKLRDHLDQRLIQTGFQIYKITGDGKCLYRAVSQMYYESQDFFQYIKDQMLDIYALKPSYLVDGVKNYHIAHNQIDQTINDEQGYRRYVEKISEKDEYGGQLQLTALSDLLRCAFIVHTYNVSVNNGVRKIDDAYISICSPNLKATLQNTNHLGFYKFSNDAFNHYFYIKPMGWVLKRFNAKDKYSRLIQKMNQNRQHNQIIAISSAVGRIQISSRQDLLRIERTENNQINNQMRPQPNKSNQKSNQKQKPDQVTRLNPLMYLTQIWGQQNYKNNYQLINFQNSENPLLGSRILFHTNKQLNVKKFVCFEWYSLLIVNLDNCQIDNQGWRTLIRNRQTLRNVKQMSIEYNLLTVVLQDDIAAFDSLNSINFGYLQGMDNRSIDYLRKKRQQAKIKVSFILPDDK